MEVQRIWYRYENFEEYHFGMWRTIMGIEREKMLTKVIKFMKNTQRFAKSMMKVFRLWHYSIQFNLSNTSLNRIAWLGQAACCLALNCPQDITRSAWHELSIEHQNKADNEAQKVIDMWEKQYQEGLQLCLNMA